MAITSEDRERVERLKATLRNGDRSNRMATVYLITGDDVIFKIGRSNNVVGRITGFQTGSPQRLRVVHLILTYKAVIVESALKRLFKAQRSHGEWFLLTSEDVEFVKSLHRNNIEKINDYATIKKGFLRWKWIYQ